MVVSCGSLSMENVYSAEFRQALTQNVPSHKTFSKSQFVCLQETNNTEKISKKHKLPLLNLRSISGITQLMPFFKTLCCAFTRNRSESQNSHNSASLSVDYVGSNGVKILKQLEESVECDFLENMES